ncbi:MAG: PHP domain-containing protein [Treponemataceae bacterium]
MIDLHTHSNASDGTFSPRELIAEAASRGLTAIALTDHDTIAGIPEAAEAAKGFGIKFIPGIEMEIAFEPGECHLLGLGISTPSDEFIETIKDLAERREARNLAILELMRESGVEAQYAEVERYAEGKVIGRPHFASLLIERKLVRNREQAFSRYLGKGRPFFVPKASLELRRAIRLIKESGGKSILAHPLSLYVAWGRLPSVISEWKELGLDGLEAWHPAAKVRACERLEKMAKDFGMLVTAGSDFHGASRPDRKLGITAGGKKIDERYMESL